MRTLKMLFARWRAQAYLDFMYMTRDFRFFIINIVSRHRPQSGLDHRRLSAGRAVRGDRSVVWRSGPLHAGLRGHGSRPAGRGMRLQRPEHQPPHRPRPARPHARATAAAVDGAADRGVSCRSPGCGRCSPASASWPGRTLNLGAALPLGWWLMLACSLLASCAIVLAFSYLWGSLAFWAPGRRRGDQQPGGRLPVSAQVVSARRLELLPARRHAHRPAGRLRRVVSVPSTAGHRAARLLAHAAGGARRVAGGGDRLQERTEALCTDRIAAVRRLGTSRLGSPRQDHGGGERRRCGITCPKRGRRRQRPARGGTLVPPAHLRVAVEGHQVARLPRRSARVCGRVPHNLNILLERSRITDNGAS